jgi:hypothetical protein
MAIAKKQPPSEEEDFLTVTSVKTAPQFGHRGE